METDLFKQLEFIKEIDKIKQIKRKSKHFSDNEFENDAEHSWHISIMAIVLQQHTNTTVDLFKVITMLLIHDIVEIDAGDVYVYDKTAADTENEKKAANRIFGILPDAQKEQFISLWNEFEDRITPESKYANAIDRLQPVLQNIHNGCETWKAGMTSREKVLTLNSKIGDASETLWSYIEKEINDSFDGIEK